MKHPIDDSPGGLAILLKPHHPEPDGDEGAGQPIPDGLEDAMKDFCEAEEVKDYAGMARAWMDADALADDEKE